MTSDRLRNIDRFIDRHGKPRHYYRCAKGARIRLPGEPGSPEFIVAYTTAAEKIASFPDSSIDGSGSRLDPMATRRHR